MVSVSPNSKHIFSPVSKQVRERVFAKIEKQNLIPYKMSSSKKIHQEFYFVEGVVYCLVYRDNVSPDMFLYIE